MQHHAHPQIPLESTPDLAVQIWGFPKTRGTLLGVPIIRTRVFWGLCWGPLILGNYHDKVSRLIRSLEGMRKPSMGHSFATPYLKGHGGIPYLGPQSPTFFPAKLRIVVLKASEYVNPESLTVGLRLKIPGRLHSAGS